MKTKTSKTSKQSKQSKRTVAVKDLKAKKNAKGGAARLQSQNNLKQMTLA